MTARGNTSISLSVSERSQSYDWPKQMTGGVEQIQFGNIGYTDHGVDLIRALDLMLYTRSDVALEIRD